AESGRSTMKRTRVTIGLCTILALVAMTGVAQGRPVAVVGLHIPPRLAAPGAVGSPPAREDGGLATDSTGNVVLFGGFQAATDTYLGDTWTWDGTSWTEQHPADSPTPRAGFGMVYDGARHQVVLWGGSDGYTTFQDTWVWNGVGWKQRHPQHSPIGTNLGEDM